MKLTGYETFCLYLALKNHFTQTSYDFFRYKGKVRVPPETFLRRRDRFQFERLARKYNDDEMRDLIIANLLVDKQWVGDLLDDEAYEHYTKQQKVKQSLTYIFSNDVDRLMSSVDDPKELFRMKENEYPLIIDMLQRQEITLETFIILNQFIQFIPKFNEKLKDDYLWSKIGTKATKYTPFVQFDRKKMMDIMKEKML